jgi:hypothetical protein
VQLVDTDRRQQRFDTGDEGNREDPQDYFADLVRPRLPARGRWRKFGQGNGIEKVGRERDSVDTFQPRSFCNCGRHHDGHECARDEADLGGQLWPQQQNGDDQPANDHFVQFVMEDAAR